MILHPPQLTRDAETVTLSTRVEIETPGRGDEELWFRCPRRCEPLLQTTSDAGVTAALFLAMRLGEPVRALAPLSEQLAYGLGVYQRYFAFWYPHLYSEVPIEGELTRPAPPPSAGGALSAFSGGVDSFYTLRHHLEEPRERYRVRRLLFGHGLDIPLSDPATYAACRESYEELAQELGLELVPVTTNLRHLLRGLQWEHACGAGLAAVAHTVSRENPTFLIPSSMRYCARRLWGTNAAVDPLLGTEALQVIHHDSARSRADKLAEIHDWEVAHSRLRVCWEHLDGQKNCCRCEKCFRTMLILDLLGSLEQFETFPLPLDHRRLNGWSRDPVRGVRIVATLADEVGRHSLARRIRFAAWRGEVLLTLRRAGIRVRAGLGRRVRRLLARLRGAPRPPEPRTGPPGVPTP